MRRRTPDKFLPKLGILAAFALLLFVWWRKDWGCLLQRNTGIPCPGCGLTRAWLAAVKLDFAAALSWHPMFWSVPALVWFLFYDLEPLGSRRWNRWILGLILAGWALAYGWKLVTYFGGMMVR